MQGNVESEQSVKKKFDGGNLVECAWLHACTYTHMCLYTYDKTENTPIVHL